MKSVLLFLFIPLLLTAQENVVLTLESLDPGPTMKALFASESYTFERGVRWRPGLEAQTEFVLSDDGFLYTRLDTIIYYELYGYDRREERALVVFSTHSWFGGERSTCHACAPEVGAAVFQRTEEGDWGLERFRKYLGRYGGWGEGPEISLVRLGEATYALELASGYTGQGYTEAYAEWFDLHHWREAFASVFRYRESYGPAGCDEECDADWCDNFEDISCDIAFEPNGDPDSDNPGYDDLIATITSRTCDGKATKRVERYAYGMQGYGIICGE